MTLSSRGPTGGSSTSRSDHRPPSQEEESPLSAARPTQGVPQAEGEGRGGQDEETEGDPEKTLQSHGADGAEEAEVQSEGRAEGLVTSVDASTTGFL